jgi:hypothetical protein
VGSAVGCHLWLFGLGGVQRADLATGEVPSTSR